MGFSFSGIVVELLVWSASGVVMTSGLLL